MTRRTSTATAAALVIAAAGAAGTLAAPAAAAGLGTATPTPATIVNTATAQTVTIANSIPVLGTAKVELVGPGSLSDTYAGTGVTSGSSATFNLDPAGLPAAPGTYALNVCELSCPLTLDSGKVTVTGAAPAPGTPTPFVIAPGSSATITIPGKGFAKDETVSISRPGGVASDATFTEDNATSTATSLTGKLALGAALPNGAYDLKITDAAGQVGTCAGCLQTAAGFPVKSLVATPLTASIASVTWKPPTGGPTPTSYTVVVSKTSQTTTDTGITVNVDNANQTASVTGLTGSTTYFVTVTATAGTTTSPPAFTEMTTPNPTGLSLQASRTSLVAGASVDLTGVLVHKVGSNPSSPMSGQTVIITGKSDTGKVSKVGTTSTDTDGNYDFRAFPTRDTMFGAYFAGAPHAGSTPDSAAISNSFPTVSVAPLVVAAPRHSKIGRHAQTVLVLGFVTPKEVGRTVHLVRIDGTGAVHNVSHATLTGSSHYAVRGRVPKTRGTYSFQVRISQHVGNAAGKSRTFHVTRKSK